MVITKWPFLGERNNYEMAFKRVQKLEKRLQINSEIAVAYEDTIRKHIQKGYIRRVEHAEVVLTSFSSCLNR